jgi:uncharacterized protein (UPF0335 family)
MTDRLDKATTAWLKARINTLTDMENERHAANQGVQVIISEARRIGLDKSMVDHLTMLSYNPEPNSDIAHRAIQRLEARMYKEPPTLPGMSSTVQLPGMKPT